MASAVPHELTICSYFDYYIVERKSRFDQTKIEQLAGDVLLNGTSVTLQFCTTIHARHADVSSQLWLKSSLP